MMRTFIFGILLLMAVAIPFTGCDRQRRLSPQRWVAAGGEFDSLTLKLEWQFNDFAPFDSIRMSIENMERLAGSDKDSSLKRLKKERALYWKARYLWRLEYTDSSLQLARKALSLNDSIKHNLVDDKNWNYAVKHLIFSRLNLQKSLKFSNLKLST